MTAIRHHLGAVQTAASQRASTVKTQIQQALRLLVASGRHLTTIIGVTVLFAILVLFTQDQVRHELETNVLGWLTAKHAPAEDEASSPLTASGREEQAELKRALADPDAVARATAADPKELTRQQAAVAQWISRKYRVAPEPISRLVKEAWAVGSLSKIEPTLILAIMAVESSFNPFAQSSVGAQGLMQVMTRVHDDKYEAFGGNHAAFDPVTNLRVGVQVLKEAINRAGSLEGGLRHYVGAANLPTDGGYADKVMAEHLRMQAVAGGKANAGTPAYAANGGAKPKTVVLEQPVEISQTATEADSSKLLSAYQPAVMNPVVLAQASPNLR